MTVCPLCGSLNARIESHGFSTCPETGHVDGGDLLVCECGTWEMDEVDKYLKVGA